MVSCGVRLSEVGLSEIRKPQVGGSIPLAGSSLFKDLILAPLHLSNWRSE